MGVNFRKSIKIGRNTRINISKTGGIGFSTGIRGFRISKNKKGIRFSIGLDGVYYTKHFSAKKKKRKSKLKDIETVQVASTTEEIEFERVPTNDEMYLLAILGNKAINYPLAIFMYSILILLVAYFVDKNRIIEILLATDGILLVLYLLFSKYNRYCSLVNRAIRSYNNEKYEKSYKSLTKAITKKPQDHKVLTLLAFTSYNLEKHAEALEYIKQLNTNEEPLEVISFIEAQSNSHVGNYQEAITAIEKVYSEDETIKNAKYKILGDSYFGLKDYDTAINWYEQLPIRDKETTDENIEYKYVLGHACLLSGNEKRAFKYLSKVYDYNANYKDVKLLLNKV